MFEGFNYRCTGANLGFLSLWRGTKALLSFFPNHRPITRPARVTAVGVKIIQFNHFHEPLLRCATLRVVLFTED